MCYNNMEDKARQEIFNTLKLELENKQAALNTKRSYRNALSEDRGKLSNKIDYTNKEIKAIEKDIESITTAISICGKYFSEDNGDNKI